MKEELFLKFLKNRLNEEESALIISWLKKDSLNNDSKIWAQNYWSTIDEENDELIANEKFEIILDKIHHKININNVNQPKLLTKNYFSMFSKWVTRAAAIVLLPTLAFLFYISNNYGGFSQLANFTTDTLEVTTPIGSRTLVQLSDGSQVYLNYGSKIKYPQKFFGNSREVELSGEGYFKIAHNPEKPFIVNTKNLNIKAVGTEFNVKSYPNDNIINTSLVNGKVIIERTNSKGEVKVVGTMAPGQNVSYNVLTTEISSSKGNIKKYISWKDGRLIFENESITDVANILSRMFNVDIEIKENAKIYTYTVTIVDEPLFQILDLMKIATPIKYKVLPRQKLPDGTFSKQKIIVEKNI